MEEEVKCPMCKQLYSNPILLPCYHAVCLNCAVQIQQPVPPQQILQQMQNGYYPRHSQGSCHQPHNIVVTKATVHRQPDGSRLSDSANSSGAEDSDKASVLSETDSGVVVCSSFSRPGSYVGNSNMHGLLFPPIQSTAFELSCPVCRKTVYFDENGAHNLPRYRVMQNIVERFVESRGLGVKCQLCEGGPKGATVMCEQCEVFYCEKCRENCHPLRGPLAKHSLVSAVMGRAALKEKAGPLQCKCPEHPVELLEKYCVLCKVPVCDGCIGERKHAGHEVQPIQSISKAQKTELSHNLQQLSEKAKSGTEFIQRLKSQTEKINENCSSMENLVTLQIDTLIAALQQRKEELVTFVRREKDYKLRSLKTEVSSLTHRLQQTTGLIHFCIEALKETDPSAYLQVGTLLLARVAHLESSWANDDDSASSTDDSGTQLSLDKADCRSRSSASSIISSAISQGFQSSLFNPEFDLTLDERSVLVAIRQLNFIQMKPPAAVHLIPEECTAENNSITVAWQPPPTSFVEGYVLEIDDGVAEGTFREVYCGKETICTVDGLHFNSVYHARVKAFNSTGEGDYSEHFELKTAEVAWFTFDPSLSPRGARLSNGNCTATSDSYEPRVILGSVGFARGVHYWEFSVEKYEASADPCFGVARLEVNKEEMLGKDDKGWAMYIDHQRSWFIHSGMHSNRTEGGIALGSTIGILLDLDKRQITYFVNDEQQGPVAFTNLFGVFYPAVSLNCNVTVSIHTGMDPPSDSKPSEETGTSC